MVRFLPALETLQQASNGRLELIFDDMLKVDEGLILKDEAKTDWPQGCALCCCSRVVVIAKRRP